MPELLAYDAVREARRSSHQFWTTLVVFNKQIMREIKFRLHDKETGRILGYECLMPDYKNEIYKWAISGEGVDWVEGTFSGVCNRVQYTGLKDKDGKEIYVGDILTDDMDYIFEAKFGVLPLNKGGDCVCSYQAFYAKAYGKLGASPQYDCEEIADYMEVIGNIYENPELLGNKRDDVLERIKELEPID